MRRGRLAGAGQRLQHAACDTVHMYFAVGTTRVPVLYFQLTTGALLHAALQRRQYVCVGKLAANESRYWKHYQTSYACMPQAKKVALVHP